MKSPGPSGPGSLRRAPGVVRIAMVCALYFACPHRATAQIFELTGGASSMFNAEGGSVEIHAQDYSGRIDLGYLGRPSLGFAFSRPFKTFDLTAGDQQIPFALPTDLFNNSFYFLGRGLSYSQHQGDSRLFVFAGETSDGYFAPFLNVARNDTPAGAIFYEKQLSPALRFFSRTIFSHRQTSIQALEWTARKDIKMALSAGLGNNQPYGATSVLMDTRWMMLDASYALAGNAFQRVLVASPQLSENDRENIRLELRPFSNFRLLVSRNNYLADIPPNGVERAMVQGVGAAGSVAGFQLNGSWFDSASSSGSSTAFTLGVRHMITQHFEAGVEFMRSGFAKEPPDHSLVGDFREILNSRLSVTQVISRSNGQTSVDFGGNFISNFATVSVDYQTVFLPFVQSSSGQFKQVMVVGLHFQLPHGLKFNMDSYVTPLGQVRYTAYGSTYAYRGLGRESSGASFSGTFYQNMVRGEVLDPEGQPIAGAALQIGAEIAFTDSEGNFLLRMKKAGELNLKVAFGEFATPGRYAVVQAPQTVKVTRQDSAQEYTIVLRRLPNDVSSADPSHQPDVPDSPPDTK
jgi:hypothetical protein